MIYRVYANRTQAKKFTILNFGRFSGKDRHGMLQDTWVLFLQEKEAKLIEDRQIRAEQDLAFEESLRADIAKV